MSYADIRFQRIENNINELKESIKFLSDIMHNHLLDKNNKEDKEDKEEEEETKNNKKVYEKEKKQKNDPKSRIMEWVTCPSTILYGTSIFIGAFTSYGLYHFYNKK
jgi:CO dehydrogenase/acetyl-CoA synthase beta subunit